VTTLIGVGLLLQGFESAARAQGELPVVPGVVVERPYPDRTITATRETVSQTAASARLNAGLIRRLLIPLDDANASLQRAEAAAAIRHLDVFDNKLRALVSARRFPSQAGAQLFGFAHQARTEIVSLLSTEHFARGLCDAASFDGAARLSVGPTPTGDFATVGEALAFAADQHFLAVELFLAPGDYYEEDLLPITRHTRLHGSGIDEVVLHDASIVNLGPNLLSVEGLKLQASGWPGAVVVEDSCAETILTDVEISAAEGFGIRQEGGSLTMHNVAIHRTLAVEDDPETGVALYLTNRVAACLAHVNLLNNTGGAITAEGDGTLVHAAGVTVDRNAVHPLRIEAGLSTGAIDVRERALFLGEFMQVTRNEIAGLLVHSDASAHVRYSSFSRTQAQAGLVGVNAYVREAELELTACTLEFADAAGLRVEHALVRVRDSSVTDSPLGLSVQLFSGCDLDCFQEGVVYARNGRNLDTEFLGVPPTDPFAGDDSDPEPRGHCCAFVPFAAPWCE
jgi:hypothetical protein